MPQRTVTKLQVLLSIKDKHEKETQKTGCSTKKNTSCISAGAPVSNTDRYIEGTDDLTMIRVVKHKNDRSMSNIKDKSH